VLLMDAMIDKMVIMDCEFERIRDKALMVW
jgi:hypothetical protein